MGSVKEFAVARLFGKKTAPKVEEAKAESVVATVKKAVNKAVKKVKK